MHLEKTPQQELAAVIEHAQLERLLEISVRTIGTGLILGIFLTYIQAINLSSTKVYWWLGLLALLSFVRMFIVQYFIRNPAKSDAQTHARLTLIKVGIIVTSILWGGNVFLADYSRQFEYLLFLSYILAGISASAVVSYSIEKVSALSYIVFSVVPLLVKFLLIGTDVSIVMSLSGLLFIVFLSFSVLQFNASLLENISLRHASTQREEEVRKMAFYDMLTNLPNRRLLQDRLQHALRVSQRYGNGGALLFIDIDKFKLLNDTHGHEKGDALLKEVAKRLKQSVRQSDTVARMGGDEFVVMIENLSDEPALAKSNAEAMANNMLEKLSQPYDLDGLIYDSYTSIGIAMFGEHGNHDDAILRNADAAMYRAKKQGGRIVKLFEQ
jgi:diguanylate cyclase (GGDEF)-like protein